MTKIKTKNSKNIFSKYPR